MTDRRHCEFFLLRYVPDAVKDEFVNIGVVLLESRANGAAGFAGVRFTQDWRRVRCLDPRADLDMLQALEDDLRRALAGAASRDAFLEKVKDSFSGSLQLSPAKAVLAEYPEEELNALAQAYVEAKRPARDSARASARQRLRARMRGAFESAGVWQHMMKNIAAAEYTRPGDPLKIDCGYRPNGVIKLFHALPLAAEPDAAKVLAFSYPLLAGGIRSKTGAEAQLTAIVEDSLRREDEPVAFALGVLEQSRIAVAAAAELPRLAEVARRELRI
jgi:hypothetical protein